MEQLEQCLPGSPPPPTPAHVYPEHLLHESDHANRYYGALQCHSRQFVPANAHLVRFAHLELERVLQKRVAHWDTGALRPGAAPTKSLFLWSSTDRTVAARRRALEHDQTDRQNDAEQDSGGVAGLAASAPLTFVRRVGAVAERESNRFVQLRLAAIKAHHVAAASLKVDERKRRDHEARAARARQKEQAFERAVQAAIAEQAQKRQLRFLGLFGARGALAGFTLDQNGGTWHSPVSPKRGTRSPQPRKFLPPVSPGLCQQPFLPPPLSPHLPGQPNKLALLVGTEPLRLGRSPHSSAPVLSPQIPLHAQSPQTPTHAVLSSSPPFDDLGQAFANDDLVSL